MKTTQETILELAKSRGVLLKALAKVGPATNGRVKAWPGELALESVQATSRSCRPRARSSARPKCFTSRWQTATASGRSSWPRRSAANCKIAWPQLREAKARSTIDELTHSRQPGAGRTWPRRPQAIGQGGARRWQRPGRAADPQPNPPRETAICGARPIELEKELRGFQATQIENEESLKLLERSADRSEQAVGQPQRAAQVAAGAGPLEGRAGRRPAAQRPDAGNDVGRPSAGAGPRAAEDVIRQQLHEEIDVAIQGVEVDQPRRCRSHPHAGIAGCRDPTAIRPAGLGASRVFEPGGGGRSRAESLKTVEHELAEVRASQAAARTASLISPVDDPDTGTRPLGPGKTTIAAGGFGGGLTLSLAILFWSIPPVPAASQSPERTPGLGGSVGRAPEKLN